jgi:hypothetical protein
VPKVSTVPKTVPVSERPPERLDGLKDDMQSLRLTRERNLQSGRGGLMHFVRYFWEVLEPETPMVEGWPMVAVCQHLEAIAYGEIRKFGWRDHPPDVTACIFWLKNHIEDKTRGRDVAQEINRLYAREKWGVELIPVARDKTSRAHSTVSMFTDNGVWAPQTKWSDAVIKECADFPKAAALDAASLMLVLSAVSLAPLGAITFVSFHAR